MIEEEPEKCGRGAPAGNLNAVKKPEIWLPENLDYLNSPEDILRFQKRVIHALYTGQLGARQAGAINHGLETLLKFHLDSKKLAEYESYFQRVKALVERAEAKENESSQP